MRRSFSKCKVPPLLMMYSGKFIVHGRTMPMSELGVLEDADAFGPTFSPKD